MSSSPDIDEKDIASVYGDDVCVGDNERKSVVGDSAVVNDKFEDMDREPPIEGTGCSVRGVVNGKRCDTGLSEGVGS